MSDYTELKRLAEAAPEGPWFGPEYAPGTSHVFDVDLGTLLHYESIDTEQDACLRYVAAANPAAVLELIDSNKRLKAGAADTWEIAQSRARIIDQLKAENAGLKTGYEAYERVNAELRAECESLRKDAERVRGHLEIYESLEPLAEADRKCLAARGDQYERDAARYRWLRDQHNSAESDIGVYNGHQILKTKAELYDLHLDYSVDDLMAAMSKEQSHE